MFLSTGVKVLLWLELKIRCFDEIYRRFADKSECLCNKGKLNENVELDKFRVDSMYKRELTVQIRLGVSVLDIFAVTGSPERKRVSDVYLFKCQARIGLSSLDPISNRSLAPNLNSKENRTPARSCPKVRLIHSRRSQ